MPAELDDDTAPSVRKTEVDDRTELSTRKVGFDQTQISFRNEADSTRLSARRLDQTVLAQRQKSVKAPQQPLHMKPNSRHEAGTSVVLSSHRLAYDPVLQGISTPTYSVRGEPVPSPVTRVTPSMSPPSIQRPKPSTRPHGLVWWTLFMGVIASGAVCALVWLLLN